MHRARIYLHFPDRSRCCCIHTASFVRYNEFSKFRPADHPKRVRTSCNNPARGTIHPTKYEIQKFARHRAAARRGRARMHLVDHPKFHLIGHLETEEIRHIRRVRIPDAELPSADVERQRSSNCTSLVPTSLISRPSSSLSMLSHAPTYPTLRLGGL